MFCVYALIKRHLKQYPTYYTCVVYDVIIIIYCFLLAFDVNSRVSVGSRDDCEIYVSPSPSE